MNTPLYWIPGPWVGRLATAARPRGGDWLEDEIAAWKANGVAVVVSALTRQEANYLDLDREEVVCKSFGVEFLSFPIPDVDIPGSIEAVEAFLAPIQAKLGSGQCVVVHCRMGIGRSSTLAACLLVMAGVAPDDAFQRICKARGCAVPDTPEQKRWVEGFAKE
jgi:protein-tyrosine phosphatase